MALIKKKSRGITVNQNRYRYQISSTKIDHAGNYSLNLTVQVDDGFGSVLKVLGLLTRDYWLDFSEFGVRLNKDHYPIITPKYVANVIKLALSQGWKPNNSGSSFELEITNDDFFNSSAEIKGVRNQRDQS